MNETNIQNIWQGIKSIFLHQTVQILVVVGGLAVTLVNLFIASKLTPIAANVSTVALQVQAQSTRLDADEKYIPQFIQTQQIVEDQQAQLSRIETKVDATKSEVDDVAGFLRSFNK